MIAIYARQSVNKMDSISIETQIEECEKEVHKGETADAEEEFLLSERKRLIYKALDTLPEDEKLLMHLLYIENLGYEQAEKVLKISKNKLYQIARKAKEKLKAGNIAIDTLSKEQEKYLNA